MHCSNCQSRLAGPRTPQYVRNQQCHWQPGIQSNILNLQYALLWQPQWTQKVALKDALLAAGMRSPPVRQVWTIHTHQLQPVYLRLLHTHQVQPGATKINSIVGKAHTLAALLPIIGPPSTGKGVRLQAYFRRKRVRQSMPHHNPASSTTRWRTAAAQSALDTHCHQ